MRVLIVDDEPLARARLRALLADSDAVEVVGEAGDGRTALEAVSQLRPGVVLLDIRMPGMDGLEVARHLHGWSDAPAVVFVTAYGDQALAAFEASAVDYLLKPVREERLAVALERARRLLGPRQAPPVEAGKVRSHLCARLRGSLKLVPVEDVLYLLADAKYVEVHYPGGSVLIEDSLVSLEQEFGERFIRIHRNCLVAAGAIAGLEKRGDGETVVTLRGTEMALEVSRRNLPNVRRWLRQ
ncbi:MAG: LytTR family DNA-binding domain-containing protein [Xanthomonadales bacterium]|nr:LytTR family DNA-binding domain-containing protein [Xanthomonadales bacterium]